MKQLLSYASSFAICAMTAGSVQAASVNISLVYEEPTDFSSAVMGVLDMAVELFSTGLGGYLDDLGAFAGPTITVATKATSDGLFGNLASGGWITPIFGTNYAYTDTARVEFDAVDMQYAEDNGGLEVFGLVALHEIAHAMGFGLLWNVPGYQQLYDEGNFAFTGAAAVAAYQASCDAGATFVPVEDEGGSGTVGSHWDEDWACGGNDILTGTFESIDPTYYQASAPTQAVWADMGYSLATTAVPVPATLGLLASGMGLFGLMRRRKQG